MRVWQRRIPGVWRYGLVVLGLLVLFGCDRTPSGEGDWRVVIHGPGEPFGAAVVSVSGEGVLGLASLGDAEVWTHQVDAGEFRAVLIRPASPGDLGFRVRVRELRDPAPSVAILELADQDDQPVPIAAEHRLRLLR